MGDVMAAKEAAAEVAAEEQGWELPPRELTLSTGITLKLKPVPQAVIRRAASKVPRPVPPKFFVPDKDREEENPDDPDYLRAVDEWTAQQALAVQKVVYLMGTEPAMIPDGAEGPQGQGWPEVPLYLGIISEEELENPYLRYIAWLETYAARTEKDQLDLLTLPIQLAGITEQEVMNAITSFRSRARGGADNGSPAPAGGEDGDNLPRALRRARARSGRKRGG